MAGFGRLLGRRWGTLADSVCLSREHPRSVLFISALAMVIANQTKSHFETLSAVLAGIAELREVIDAALERSRIYQKKTTLFVKDVVETLN
jgi:hypothetical protein